MKVINLVEGLYAKIQLLFGEIHDYLGMDIYLYKTTEVKISMMK